MTGAGTFGEDDDVLSLCEAGGELLKRGEVTLSRIDDNGVAARGQEPRPSSADVTFLSVKERSLDHGGRQECSDEKPIEVALVVRHENERLFCGGTVAVQAVHLHTKESSNEDP